jgi:arsenate reductase
MSKVVLWHNPRCSKSRAALALLQEHSVEPQIRLYLEERPTYEELQQLLKTLQLSASELIRTTESLYKELSLKDQDGSDAALLKAMVEHPKLIQRPILVVGQRAKIGRPPEDLLELLA